MSDTLFISTTVYRLHPRVLQPPRADYIPVHRRRRYAPPSSLFIMTAPIVTYCCDIPDCFVAFPDVPLYCAQARPSRERRTGC